MNSIEWLDSIWTDLRYAFRELHKHPFITATAALMLAAGIGVNVAVFSIVNAVLFKGYSGVRDNDRLVYMTSYEGCCVSYADFLDWRVQAQLFEGMEIPRGFRYGSVTSSRSALTPLW